MLSRLKIPEVFDADSVARYLVVKALKGDGFVIDALYEYFVLNNSPSEISRKYNITKGKLRGYVERIVLKCGNHRWSRHVIERTYKILKQVKPMIEVRNNRNYCIICNKYVKYAATHIRKMHSDTYNTLINRIVNEVVREL